MPDLAEPCGCPYTVESSGGERLYVQEVCGLLPSWSSLAAPLYCMLTRSCYNPSEGYAPGTETQSLSNSPMEAEGESGYVTPLSMLLALTSALAKRPAGAMRISSKGKIFGWSWIPRMMIIEELKAGSWGTSSSALTGRRRAALQCN